jgi:iron complex transport system substrate-binding protein
VVFASWCGKKVNFERIRRRPGWDGVSAVRDDLLFEVKSSEILQPGPASLTDGVGRLHAVFTALAEKAAR